MANKDKGEDTNTERMLETGINPAGVTVALPPGRTPDAQRKTPLFSSILWKAGNQKSLHSNMEDFLTKLLGPEDEEKSPFLAFLTSVSKRSAVPEHMILHHLTHGFPWHHSIPLPTPANPFSTAGYVPCYHPTPLLRKEAPKDRKRGLGRELFSGILRTSGW